MKAITVQKRFKAIEAKIKSWKEKLHELQRDCPHHNLTYRNKGSAGGWDRDDNHWRDWQCSDCNRRWITDQDSKSKALYPHAKDITHT